MSDSYLEYVGQSVIDRAMDRIPTWTPPYAARFVDIRFPDGKLAFRFDPQRGIVEIVNRREVHYFDLAVVEGAGE